MPHFKLFFFAQVLAYDPDTGDNGMIRYEITYSYPSNAFNINPITGQITTAVMLNREVRECFHGTLYFKTAYSEQIYCDISAFGFTILLSSHIFTDPQQLHVKRSCKR